MKLFKKFFSTYVILVLLFTLVGSLSYLVNSIKRVEESSDLSNHQNITHEINGIFEQYMADLDSRISEAERRAVAYVQNGDYNRYSHPDIPIGLQNIIRATEDLNDVVNMVYFYHASYLIEELIDIYDKVVSSLNNSEDSDYKVVALASELVINVGGSTLNARILLNSLNYVFEDGEMIDQTGERFTVNLGQ